MVAWILAQLLGLCKLLTVLGIIAYSCDCFHPGSFRNRFAQVSATFLVNTCNAYSHLLSKKHDKETTCCNCCKALVGNDHVLQEHNVLYYVLSTYIDRKDRETTHTHTTKNGGETHRQSMTPAVATQLMAHNLQCVWVGETALGLLGDLSLYKSNCAIACLLVATWTTTFLGSSGCSTCRFGCNCGILATS